MNLTDILRRDTEAAPHAFLWQGPIPRPQVEDALWKMGYAVPDELVDLWVRFGVGEMFESENILNPTDDTEDGLRRRNSWFRSQGMSEKYMVFCEGGFWGAIRQPDCAIVQIDHRSFREVDGFATLKEWYERCPRTEFWWRYGLPENSA